MCLSTAFKQSNGAEYKIGEYISDMQINGEEIVLTDIMGSVTKVIGKLKRIDLAKNVIIIEAES